MYGGGQLIKTHIIRIEESVRNLTSLTYLFILCQDLIEGQNRDDRDSTTD